MSESFLYCGRMVPKAGFRAFIYSKDGGQKLVNSYDEFESSISSGIWLVKKPDLEEVKPTKKRRE